MQYHAPVNDILVALKTSANLDSQLASGLYDGLDEATVVAILNEAGSFASDVLAPLNSVGDDKGSKLNDGVVTTPPGFGEAYKQFVAGGWPSLPCGADYDGQDLPEIVSLAVTEIWNAANLSFGLCPLLTHGAVHALEAGGSDALKARFLPKMVAGTWTGTMNLTEPQAGSDLSALTTKAERRDDGTYAITGTKIYITYGEHDFSENIIHLVLARLPDAPAGTRGISLFVVPKFLVNDDGTLGARNDVVCVGLEHKLGIHASPTCVMKFGEKGGATGYLVGTENRGLANMFVMMNNARLAVGIQGVALADRATQAAIAYAKDRHQGQAVASGEKDASARRETGARTTASMVAIIAHPNIRRKLLTMRATTQAARMICFATAGELDVAHLSKDADARSAASHRAALLTPVAKAFSTDLAVEIASIGIQVHGGMGFVEETGAAQFLRDSRILPIYEGTNGIQAIDLVTRKLPLGDGAVIDAYLSELDAVAAAAAASNQAELGRTSALLTTGIAALRAATRWMLEQAKDHPDHVLAGATPYLQLFGIVSGGTYLAKAALAADRRDQDVVMARFFAENIITAAPGLAETVTTAAQSVLADPSSEVFA